jgi:hypothetical protein
MKRNTSIICIILLITISISGCIDNETKENKSIIQANDDLREYNVELKISFINGINYSLNDKIDIKISLKNLENNPI